MFAMEDLKPFFDNANIEINGMNFKLTKEEDMAGELAVWHSQNYKVLATPNFDEVPIPIEVSEIDENGDYNIINADGYYGEVNSFEQYAEIVKTLAKKILENHKIQ
ncbi:hypothetical protein DU86_08510 [Methanosarcina mazei]|uniref:Uncharacterized protein n=1 Tax=Methanosarcina mazei TaxID=2209 RepID=A0A0F8RTC1_METMZ|nr:hypothetical protein [Methanosarcina mazei]KKF98490.1 hypothetical protein DU31_08020 [Methanosarcina mazei]KKH39377.1 hypothetical protein DU50_06715 [Methanosarcina mazei]KKH51292.1 hypothetical protein DU85_08910 [Methanosarcina mazei]KKH53110.1 hypothetical protein DU76_10635 [Methanosarcina mazei]KKH64079.1 hypothetical protein DU73_09800 [Methanosarcina mazei]